MTPIQARGSLALLHYALAQSIPHSITEPQLRDHSESHHRRAVLRRYLKAVLINGRGTLVTNVASFQLSIGLSNSSRDFMAWFRHKSEDLGLSSKEYGVSLNQSYKDATGIDDRNSTMLSSHQSSHGRLFYVGISPANHNLVHLHSHLHPDGYALDPPVYSARVDLNQKPNVTVSRGSMRPENIIAAADFHKYSGKVDLTIRSQPIHMKSSSMGAKHMIDLPGLGECKWKLTLANASPELTDAAGRMLAKMDGAVSDYVWSGADNRLEVLVPLDDDTMDVIVVSAIVLWVNMKVTAELTKKSTAFGIGVAAG